MVESDTSELVSIQACVAEVALTVLQVPQLVEQFIPVPAVTIGHPGFRVSAPVVTSPLGALFLVAETVCAVLALRRAVLLVSPLSGELFSAMLARQAGPLSC